MNEEKKKLLIVCSNPEHRTTLTQMFSDDSESVTVVGSDVEALSEIDAEEHYELVILDTRMADLKRFESTYGKVWEKLNRIPAVLLTAFHEAESHADSSSEHSAANAIFRLLKSKVADLESAKCGDQQIMNLLRDRELQLREMRHRVKNNLQTIASMLNIQSAYVQDPNCLPVIQAMQSRIKSIALVYEALYEMENFEEIDFGAYLKGIVLNIFKAFSVDTNRIHLKVNAQNMVLDRDLAMHCGLILNELVTNSIKYAFRDGRSGEIGVSLQHLADGRIEMHVTDNGIGFPEEFDFKTEGNMGLLVVNALAEQIHGSLSMERQNGTTFRLLFPGKKA